VNSRFPSQPLDEIALLQPATVKLPRLSSQVGELTDRLCRLVAKSVDLDFLLSELNAKPI